MIKFFRKYNKQLLAIITALLMLSFIGGVALESLLSPSPGRQVFGSAFGAPLTQSDLNVISSETRLLSALGLPWRTPWGLERSMTAMPPLDELHYLLLLRETLHRGIKPSRELARIELQRSGRDLNRLSLDYGVATEAFEMALANYLSIQRLWGLARQSAMPSELEVQQAVRGQKETVNATIVRIQAEPLVSDETLPDSVLQAHYDQCKDQPQSETPLEFGYLIPDRLNVEYLEIDTSAIPSGRPVTTTQAEKYWRENQTQFRRPPEELVVPLPDAAGTGPDDPEPVKPKSPYYETFDEARDDVVKYLADQAKLEEARQMAGVLWQALREPWYNRSRDADGFLSAPEAVTQPGYLEGLVQSLRERLKHPAAVQVRRTGLFAESQAPDQEGIGAARADTQGGPPGVPFGANLFTVQGLVAEAPPGGRTPSLYQTAAEWLIDDHNHLYLYRVVEASKSHPPDSLDEVRDRVLADVRSLRAFEQAREHATRVEALAAQAGDLKRAWESYDGLPADQKAAVGTWFEANPFPRTAPEIFPGFRFPITITDVEGARDEQGRLLNQIRSDDFVMEAYDLLDRQGPQARGVIVVPQLECCYVIQLRGVNHITQPEYDDQVQEVEQSLARSRMESLKQFWFTPENIRSRAGYVLSS